MKIQVGHGGKSLRHEINKISCVLYVNCHGLNKGLGDKSCYKEDNSEFSFIHFISIQSLPYFFHMKHIALASID